MDDLAENGAVVVDGFFNSNEPAFNLHDPHPLTHQGKVKISVSLCLLKLPHDVGCTGMRANRVTIKEILKPWREL
jgi:hypothetical protein